MNKGFTLLELVVVIVILGVLATLGFTQYGRMVERARGVEARVILGDIRKLAAAYRLENGTVTGFAAVNANIGTDADQIPAVCRSSHYFAYSLLGALDPSLQVQASRCTGGGKVPNGGARRIFLSSNLVVGTDSWSEAEGSGGGHAPP